MRPDRVLQHAFGRDSCAEQSVISEPLNACTPENVQQMQQAMKEIYQQHGRGDRHVYERRLQLLDLDMTGQPCGKKAVVATIRVLCQTTQPAGTPVGMRVGYLVRGEGQLVLGRQPYWLCTSIMLA